MFDWIKQGLRDWYYMLTEPTPGERQRLLYKEFSEVMTMTNEEDCKSEFGTQYAFDVKYLIGDLIDRAGVVKKVRLEFPRSCLEDVLKTLAKHSDACFDYNLYVYKDTVELILREV